LIIIVNYKAKFDSVSFHIVGKSPLFSKHPRHFISCLEKRDEHKIIKRHTHTHTHPFNGPLSRTTRVSRYQKGKTNLDFTEATDSEWQWHQLGRMQVCTSLQTDNHTSTPPLSFLQAGCPSCRPTNSVKALKAKQYNKKTKRETHNHCSNTAPRVKLMTTTSATADGSRDRGQILSTIY